MAVSASDGALLPHASDLVCGYSTGASCLFGAEAACHIAGRECAPLTQQFKLSCGLA